MPSRPAADNLRQRAVNVLLPTGGAAAALSSRSDCWLRTRCNALGKAGRWQESLEEADALLRGVQHGTLVSDLCKHLFTPNYGHLLPFAACSSEIAVASPVQSTHTNGTGRF